MSGLASRIGKLAEWQLDALGAALCTAVAAAWYFAGYAPLAEAKAQRVAVAEEARAKTEELEHLWKMGRGHRESLTRTRLARESMAVRLDSPEQLLQRVSSLSKAAAETGLVLDEIKPGTLTLHERFSTVPIRMSGIGGYTAAAEFLHGLRGAFPDLGVVGMDLRGEPEQVDKPPRFVFSLVWYAALPSRPMQAGVGQ
jgi:Tfp pilus assembly protein PilO